MKVGAMDYIIVALLGMAGGAFCVFMIMEARRKVLNEQKGMQEARAEQIENSYQTLKSKERRFDEEAQRLKAERAEFDARAVPYTELQDENAILKRDLRNIHVQVRKVQLDTEVQRKHHTEIQQKVMDLGSRYLKENVKWISTSLNPNNFAASKQRLLDVIERCRGMGFEIAESEEKSRQEDLKTEFQMIVRAAFEREEQARIKREFGTNKFANGRSRKNRSDSNTNEKRSRLHSSERLPRPKANTPKRSNA